MIYQGSGGDQIKFSNIFYPFYYIFLIDFKRQEKYVKITLHDFFTLFDRWMDKRRAKKKE